MRLAPVGVDLVQEFEANCPKASAVACQEQVNTGQTFMNRADAISEDTRFRVLCLIEENPSTFQREIANALGVSPGEGTSPFGLWLEKSV